jgi:hypothetical protein
MKNIYIIIAAIFLMCLAMPETQRAKAQTNEDFMIWSGYSLTKRLNSRTSVRLRQEVRLRENATQIQKGFTDVGLRYRINKKFRLSVHYRYNLNVRRDFDFSFRHRFNADLIYREKFIAFNVPVVFNYRLRYQHGYRDFLTRETGRIPRQFVRHKFQAHLNLNSRWSPYAATEFFHTIRNFPDMDFVQNRYRLGVAYEINRNNNITMYYMIRTKQNIRIPGTDYILGFRLNVFI